MIEWLLLALLIVLSVVDIIWKKFPAGFLTGLLFLVAVVSYFNRGEVAIIYGLFCFIISWMFLEFEVPIKGVADLKLITAIGFLLVDLRFVFAFISIIMLYGLIYQMISANILYKKYEGSDIKGEEDLPFIPVILLCYITLMLLGGIA